MHLARYTSRDCRPERDSSNGYIDLRWLPVERILSGELGGWSKHSIGSLKRTLNQYTWPQIQLSPERVPETLRGLVPLAERFGLSDDSYRLNLVARTPAEDLADLRVRVRQHDSLLDEWLAGPDADGPGFSQEYIAFSAMRMAADSPHDDR